MLLPLPVTMSKMLMLSFCRAMSWQPQVWQRDLPGAANTSAGQAEPQLPECKLRTVGRTKGIRWCREITQHAGRHRVCDQPLHTGDS